MKAKWMKENPQVWQTSTTGPDAKRPKMKTWPPWADDSDRDADFDDEGGLGEQAEGSSKDVERSQ